MMWDEDFFFFFFRVCFVFVGDKKKKEEEDGVGDARIVCTCSTIKELGIVWGVDSEELVLEEVAFLLEEHLELLVLA